MLTIIGCGNPNRSDDGAGVAVVRRLIERHGGDRAPGARFFDAGTSGMEVMFKARGSSELVVVDASSSNSEPGSIFDVPGEVLANAATPGHGLHGFRWDHALYGREFPERVTVYLIERQTLELGIGLSEPVERAVQRVVQLIMARLDALCAPFGAPSERATGASGGDVARAHAPLAPDGLTPPPPEAGS